jgi:hypothetical protein
MKSIDQDQVLGILQEMKEAVRSDRTIDSRDTIELLHQIRSIGRAVRGGELDAQVLERVMRACGREDSLKQFPQMLMRFIPQVRPLVQT